MATRTLENTLDDLRARLDKLQSDMQRQAVSAGKTIADQAPNLIGKAHDVAENGVDRAEDMLSAGRRLWAATEEGLGTARDNVRVAASKTKTAIVDAASAADAGGRQTLGTVRDFVKARPVTSLFIAIAAGLAIGKVLERD